MSLSAKKQEIAAKSEPILFGVSCLRHTGLIAHSGVLELTLGQLRFRPLSGKNRNNNISILIPTEYIRSARIVGRERHLVIKPAVKAFDSLVNMLGDFGIGSLP